MEFHYYNSFHGSLFENSYIYRNKYAFCVSFENNQQKPDKICSNEKIMNDKNLFIIVWTCSLTEN